MPRLVRRAPLLERLKTYLDLNDWYLWLWEEWNDDAYGEWLKDWATPLGIVSNVVFILARGASSPSSGRGRDDVFGDSDGRSSSGWLVWLATCIVHSMTFACLWNTYTTFHRERRYRLFEQPVDDAPATSSARRVRVDSSPMSSSPWRYVQDILASKTASSRAYPDAQREVWELSVWNPQPVHLTLFTLFSPGHLVLYYSLLPIANFDPRPSVTILKTIFFGILLSLQLSYLKRSFSQQAKDSTLIHAEVMNEYDTKFVHPSLNRPVRDVGTQTRESTLTPRGTRTREVDIYTPTTILNRGFRTNPNPNYASYYDPDNLASLSTSKHTSTSGTPHFHIPQSASTPSLITPTPAKTNGSAFPRSAKDYSYPLKPHHERLRERTPMRNSDNGSLGVYTHMASPLKKAVSGGHSTEGTARDPLDAVNRQIDRKRETLAGRAQQTGVGRGWT